MRSATSQHGATGRRWMQLRRRCRACWPSRRPCRGWPRRTWCAAAAGCSWISGGGWSGPQAVADQIACTLEFPGAAQQPARVEHGLRLALELCEFVDHLSQPLSDGAAAGAGAGPDAGRRWQSARPGVPACRDARAAERDRRVAGTIRSPLPPPRCRTNRRRWSAWSAKPRISRWPRCSCRRGCARCAMRWPSCRIACRGAISRCCRPPAPSASRRRPDRSRGAA